MRVEKLLVHLHLDGIAEEIRDLCAKMPREEVAVAISRRLANDPTRGADLESRLDAALRVGLAVLTEGILVAPLEGLAEVHLRPGRNGPVRGAVLRRPDPRGRRDGAGALGPPRRRDPARPRPRRLRADRPRGRALPGGDPALQAPATPPVRPERRRGRGRRPERPGLHLRRIDGGRCGGERVPQHPPRPDERRPRRRLPRDRRGPLPEGDEAPQGRGEARGPRLGVPRGARAPRPERRGRRGAPQVPPGGARRTAGPRLPRTTGRLPSRVRTRPDDGPRLARRQPRDDGDPARVRRRWDAAEDRVSGKSLGDGLVRHGRGSGRRARSTGR